MPEPMMTVRVPKEIYDRLLDASVRYRVTLGEAWRFIAKEYEERIRTLEDRVKLLEERLRKAEGAKG
ncbi:hypothetical protein H5T53_06830 [Candidatus Bipolaricaulota bacterium]|nr:hypothetical protein [Candidatus Bipolaricaulota bacterium]